MEFWHLSELIISFIISCPVPHPQYNPCLFFHLAYWFHQVFSCLALKPSRVSSAHHGRHWLLGEKEKAGDSIEVTTANLPQPPELTILLPPHTHLSCPCFALPAGLSRKDETSGFLLSSLVIQEEEESSAFLEECGFISGRGVLVGLFSAVLKHFWIKFILEQPLACSGFQSGLCTHRTHKKGETVAHHIFLYPLLPFPHQARFSQDAGPGVCIQWWPSSSF